MVKKLGKRIAHIRKSKGVTQEELAFESELSLSQIARIETGVINTSVNTLFIIAETLKVEVKTFFEE
jgi:transcriptional regulator with XRE-family HTH domain